MTNQKLEELKKKIAEVVPEINGSPAWHGAECVKCGQGYQYDDDNKKYIFGEKFNFKYGNEGQYDLNHLNDNCGGWVRVFSGKRKRLKKITLEDVLRALPERMELIAKNGYIFFKMDPIKFRLENRWTLGQPLHLQSEECVAFLWSILCTPPAV